MPGEVWALGRHRLVCGDASALQTVARALDGEVPALTLFDPPYDVEEAWRWFRPAPKALIFTDYARVPQAMRAAAGYPVVYHLVWDNISSYYRHGRPPIRHKSAFYCAHEEGWNLDGTMYRDGKYRSFNVELPPDGVYLQTVFTLQKCRVEGKHPHAKPVEWVRALIGGTGIKSGVILDQFCGSGTAFLAAPDGVSVRAVEIDPALCAQAIERWQMFSGEMAARLS